MRMHKNWLLSALISSLLCPPAYSEELPADEVLTLKQVQEIALKNHPRISAARSDAMAAAEKVTQTKSAFMPEVSFSVTGVYGARGTRLNSTRILSLPDPANYNRLASGLTVTQLISDFGQTASLIESSQMNAKASKEQTQAARLVTIIMATEAYFRTLRSQEILKVHNEAVRLREKVLSQIRSLTKSGLKSSLDEGFEQVNLDKAIMEQRKALNDLQQDQTRLIVAMGSKENKNVKVADEPFPTTPIPPLETQMELAMQYRPDLRAVRLKHAAAQKVREAKSHTYNPKVEFLGNVNVMPMWSAPANTPNLTPFNGMGGIFFHTNLFSGFKYNSEYDEAKAKVMTANYDITDAENEVFKSVKVIWLAANTAFEQLKPAREKLEQSERNMKLADSRYRMNLGSIVELTQAQLLLVEAAIGDVDARIEYQLRRLELEYQTGKIQQDVVEFGAEDS